MHPLRGCMSAGTSGCTRSTRGGCSFPAIHKTGVIGDRAKSGEAVNQMIRRRAAQAGFSLGE